MLQIAHQSGASEGFQGDGITGPHIANGTSDWLLCNGQDVMDYRPYSTVTIPNNLCLFGHHTKHLANKHWHAASCHVLAMDTEQWVLVCWHTTHVATAGRMFICQRWPRGGLMSTTCHIRIQWSQNKVLSIWTSVTLFLKTPLSVLAARCKQRFKKLWNTKHITQHTEMLWHIGIEAIKALFQFRVVTGHLTGHNTLWRHLYQWGLLDSPLYRKCGVGEETSAHILCECEALASLRHAYLGSFFLEPEDIRSLDLGAIWNYSKVVGLLWFDMRHKGPVLIKA